MLNVAAIMGRLTADPELRTTPSDISVTTFTVAVGRSYCTRNYEDKQGNKRTAFEIVADQVSFCGSKSESEKQSQQAAAPVSNEAEEYFNSDDDLPF